MIEIAQFNDNFQENELTDKKTVMAYSSYHLNILNFKIKSTNHTTLMAILYTSLPEKQ